ncbi:hypothetical protein RB2150_10469 [Rhodobacterales bacterium HTCC2150]|jgi:hypothetical protein|nr:hypothetical protein RB2150_10469 [Rhodobacterales bacterium HTCC2150] [Rhodobacteraceae bacterium HTCC2150]
MSFVRPELRAQIFRFREVIFAVGVGLFGLWVFSAGGPLFGFIGLVIIFAGFGLALIGWRRVRLNFGEGGLGVVEVDERQISYLLSYGGFTLSIGDITAIEIQTNSLGPLSNDLFWVFKSIGQHPQSIPGNAVGAEKIYDMLASFNNVDFDKAVAAAQTTETGTFQIWKKGPRRLH